MSFQESPEDIDFQKYGLILKRHWLPSLGVMALTLALAMFAALSAKPRYEAQGTLRLTKARPPRYYPKLVQKSVN